MMDLRTCPASFVSGQLWNALCDIANGGPAQSPVAEGGPLEECDYGTLTCGLRELLRACCATTHVDEAASCLVEAGLPKCLLLLMAPEAPADLSTACAVEGKNSGAAGRLHCK
jgi:hypothetical protein